MKYTLKQHQDEYIAFLKASKYLGSMAFHGMGLGKTLSALDFAVFHLAALRAQGVHAPKCIVLMPKSAHSTWQTECNKFTPHIYRDLILIPYSQMHKCIAMCSFYDIRMIVGDEWHYLKNPTTNRMESLCNLFTAIHESSGKFAGGKILPLSGTPMPNSAAEWYTVWATLAAPTLAEAVVRLKDNKRFTKWEKTFAKKKEVSWDTYRDGVKHGSSYEGVENAEMLAQLLSPIIHFKRVEDCLDLPERTEIPIDLNLPDDKLLADANIEEPEHYMALLSELAKAKMPYMIDWVREFLKTTDKQLVIFSPYKPALFEAAEKFKKDLVLYTGEMTNTQRNDSYDLFTKGKRRIIALTYQAGAEALNLQNAHMSLYLGYPWNDAKLQQAMARTYRQGQDNSTFHYFLTSGANDQKILRKVIAKGEATSEVEDLLLDISNKATPVSIKLSTFI